MPDVSMHEIYRLIGELTATLKGVAEKVDDIRREMADSEQSATNSRANVHRRLDDLILRTTNVETDVLSVKNHMNRVDERLTGVEEVTGDVQTLRERALGAGTLGRWLIRVGIFVVTAGGWVIGAYTYLTGKPPP